MNPVCSRPAPRAIRTAAAGEVRLLDGAGRLRPGQVVGAPMHGGEHGADEPEPAENQRGAEQNAGDPLQVETSKHAIPPGSGRAGRRPDRSPHGRMPGQNCDECRHPGRRTVSALLTAKPEGTPRLRPFCFRLCTQLNAARGEASIAPSRSGPPTQLRGPIRSSYALKPSRQPAPWRALWPRRQAWEAAPRPIRHARRRHDPCQLGIVGGRTVTLER